jgi:hypothetical protein
LKDSDISEQPLTSTFKGSLSKDGGSWFFRNVGAYLRKRKKPCPGRQRNYIFHLLFLLAVAAVVVAVLILTLEVLCAEEMEMLMTIGHVVMTADLFRPSLPW